MARRHPLRRFLTTHRRQLNPLLILTHDYPDPDAMASAFALATLARATGIRSVITYGGIIGRVENRLMASLLRLPLRRVQAKDWQRCRGIALVDTQPPFSNNLFPSRLRQASIVIDHHPRHRDTHADFAYIKTCYGATATLLTHAVLEWRRPVPTRLASALAYGISSETQNLGREASVHDIHAYRTLLPYCDMRLLGCLQHPPRPRGFFLTLRRAIGRAFLYKHLIGVHLGPVDTPDVVAQVADLLIGYEGARWAICTGRYEDQCHVSLRTTNPHAEAGVLLARIIQQDGRAGGHGMIAGGTVGVGPRATAAAWRRVEQHLVRRLCEYLRCSNIPRTLPVFCR